MPKSKIQFPTVREWNPSIKTIMFARRLQLNALSEQEIKQNLVDIATMRGFGLVVGVMNEDDDALTFTASGDAWIKYCEGFIQGTLPE